MSEASVVHKGHHRYLAYRVFCCMTVIAFITTALGVAYADWQGLLMAYAILPTFVGLMMCLNLATFHFDFSIFGPLRRTAMPKEKPLARQGGDGSVGWYQVKGPMFTWIVFPAGVAFRGLTGDGFIPWQRVKRVKRVKWLWVSDIKIEHDSSEVRSPVVMGAAGLWHTIRTALLHTGSSAQIDE